MAKEITFIATTKNNNEIKFPGDGIFTFFPHFF